MESKKVLIGLVVIIGGLKVLTSIGGSHEAERKPEVRQVVNYTPPPQLTPEQQAAVVAASEREDQEKVRLIQEAAEKKAAAKKAEDNACREDASCYVKHYWIDAEVMCGHFVEERAKYDFKWSNGWGEEKFDRMDTAWDNYEGAVVRLTGNHIRFQNGFGAFSRMRYSCAYDTTTKLVRRVEVNDD